MRFPIFALIAGASGSLSGLFRKRMNLLQREIAEHIVYFPGFHVIIEHLRHRLGRIPAAEWALIVGKLDQRHFGRLFPHIRSAGDADEHVLKGRLLAHEDVFYDLNVFLDLLLTRSECIDFLP